MQILNLATGPRIPFALGVLVILLSFQVLSPLSAVAQNKQAAAAPAASPSSTSLAFNPDLMILGQLKGSAVIQSERPHSVTLLGGVQFAATYYTAKDLQDAYGATSLFSSGFDGRGETIAIIDAYGDPTINQDVATFDSEFSLPAASLTIIPVGPYEPSLGVTYGWDAETALDVEAAHAIAPYAHINLVIGANASNALFQAIKLVVDDHLGNVVSMSWGAPENSFGESGFSAAGFLNYVYADYYFQQGVSEGISFFTGSGDYGVFGGTTSATGDFPSSSPFVTSVGGTTLFLTPTSGLVSGLNTSAVYEGEEPWSISPQYIGEQASSGGGYSSFFPQPYYQAGAITSASRTFPDVAADANPYTGFVVVLEGGKYAIGGTSLASPLWAGMTADLDQYVGKDLGLLNPYLYTIYANKTEYDSAFHQVTYGYDGAYQAGPGYNLLTGLGSPDLPQLAADLESQVQGLSVTAKTSQGSSPAAPTQYSYGDTFTISATASTPQGAPVEAGTFSAKIVSVQGLVASVLLSYNGSSWEGSYTVSPTDPPGSWTITVSGTSNGYSGTGIADVDIGASLGILSPVPYPYAAPIPPNQPFEIEVSAAAPNGTAISNATLTAQLLYEGRVVSDVSLPSVGGGYYSASAEITTGEPQGTYLLVVNGASFGSVYSYVYVGEAVVGVVIAPNDDAIPSAAAGQQVTLLAKTFTSAGGGLFTSNVTAKFFSLKGELMASAKLQPAPNIVQLGVFNFFQYQQANFTVPANLTQGFYRLEFLSSYAGNSTTGTQIGNFTTGFYVSGPTLSYTISHPTTVLEGQGVEVLAKITNDTGAPVTTGVFLATFIPSGYTFEAYVTDFYGYTGVPMQYNQTLGEWEGIYQIPSVLTSPNAFVGNELSLSSGPWTVYVSGESAVASNIVPTSSFVNVAPFTSYTIRSLSPSNIQSAPLVSPNGTGYTLSNIGASSLTVRGLDITLADDSIGNLTVVNSTVRLDGSQVGSVSASNSTLALLRGTQVGALSLTSTPLTVVGSTYEQLSPALPTIAVAGLLLPLASNSPFTVTVTGEQLSAGSLTATVDGTAVPLSVTSSATGLTAKGAINAPALVDGVHTLLVKVSQSDGLSTNLTTSFSTDSQLSSLKGTVYDLAAVLAAVAIVALVLGALAFRRKAPVPAVPAAPTQV